MILLSNHLLKLQEFNIKNRLGDVNSIFKHNSDIVIRINMAHIKDRKQLEKFVDVDYDIFLDYPKGRTKPPTPTLHLPDALRVMGMYSNIKYFAVSNIETPSEVKMISNCLPKHVSFVPKIETLNGIINLKSIFETGCVNYIMLDSEDLYIDVNNDVELYNQLKDRVTKICKKYNIKLFELYGVIFSC